MTREERVFFLVERTGPPGGGRPTGPATPGHFPSRVEPPAAAHPGTQTQTTLHPLYNCTADCADCTRCTHAALQKLACCPVRILPVCLSSSSSLRLLPRPPVTGSCPCIVSSRYSARYARSTPPLMSHGLTTTQPPLVRRLARFRVARRQRAASAPPAPRLRASFAEPISGPAVPQICSEPMIPRTGPSRPAAIASTSLRFSPRHLES